MIGREKAFFLERQKQRTFMRLSRSQTDKRFLVLFFKKGLLSFCLLPFPCWAHAFLDGALPRVGSESPTVPTEVVLHFTQGVEPDFSKIEVQNASGTTVAEGAPHTKPGDPTRLAVGLKKLGAGVYTVIWHVTSVDTHKTQGKFHFTVVP